MKQVIIGIIVGLPMFQANSQPLTAINTNTRIGITTTKTTSLVFPQTILYVDRGSNDILVQQVKVAQNILMVKAGRTGFTETNLSVVTTSGRIYSLNMRYDSIPIALVYYLGASDTIDRVDEQNITFQDKGLRQSKIAYYANSLLDSKRTINSIHDKTGGLKAAIIGIYIKDNVLFFQIALRNYSSIDYDIDFTKFYLRDKKKVKRAALQERELQPLNIAGNIHSVAAHHKSITVLALEKFTIPASKYLSIEIMEKKGVEHLALKIRNHKLLHVRRLPNLK